ncbi:SseB family protein [uncultured Roseobacter sp.]|uniref:SseB family protein n=1 Tax=uncultured Roseobacter sp. TaxID=114847 RepID=UPI0026182BB2|nr:SseB family protein [uncultured Roseobacter sp.]
MTDTTPLDAAHAAMMAAPDSDTARLGFYERLADCELFLMLEAEPDDTDETVTPELFDVGDARYVLVFDRLERLAAFAGQTAAYVALSGRAIAGMLQGQGIGLGLNPDVAPSSVLLPAEAAEWLARTLGNAPDEVEARITQVEAPAGLPDSLIAAIDTKLATAMGLARFACLAGVHYDGGGRGHLLAFVDAVPQAQDALARAAAEALTFSGIEAGEMDVGFFSSADPLAAKLEQYGLRFDLPQLPENVSSVPAAPGSDPEKPPRLK